MLLSSAASLSSSDCLIGMCDGHGRIVRGCPVLYGGAGCTIKPGQAVQAQCMIHTFRCHPEILFPATVASSTKMS